MRHQRICQAIVLTITASTCLASDEFDFANMQQRIQSTVEKSMPAVVGCKIKGRPGGFSAVIVSKDGYILTAAHCVMASARDKKDKVRYSIHLADGRETEAKALGFNRTLDCALMKITKEPKEGEEWPVAELGDSAQLVVNQPVVGISHPAGHNANRGAVVRFGRIKKAVTPVAGMVLSTCLIEPGDSGGPVFDLEGRIIGINSQIRADLYLDQSTNYQVAINTFKEYWEQMKKKGSFKPNGTPGVPPLGLNMKNTRKGIELNGVRKDSIAQKAGLKRGDKIARINGDRVMRGSQLTRQYIKLYQAGATSVTLQMRTEKEDEEPREVTLELPERPERTGVAVPYMENLVEQLADMEDNLDDSIVLVVSSHGSRPLSVFATLISDTGVLISKSSQIGDDEVFVKLRTGERLAVEVIARDEPTDLVLLRCAELKGRSFVSLKSVSETKDIKHGRMLLSPSSRGPGCVSVVGSKVFGENANAIPTTAYLGILWQPSSKKVPKVMRVVPNTPAQKGKLKAGDLLLSVTKRADSGELEEPTKLKSIDDLAKYLRKSEVGTHVFLTYSRGGNQSTARIKLDRRPNTQVRRHAADFLVGGKSQRRTGFQSFFTHDGTFQQKECGSPVFDIEGNFVALNIARHSRAMCYAVPAQVVKQFVEKHNDPAGE